MNQEQEFINKTENTTFLGNVDGYDLYHKESENKFQIVYNKYGHYYEGSVNDAKILADNGGHTALVKAYRQISN